MSVDDLAQRVWDYHLMQHTMPDSAPDAIIWLGNHTLEQTVGRAVELFERYRRQPLLIFTGQRGNFTKRLLRTEAEEAESLAVQMGVSGGRFPTGKVLLEKTATNTGENVTRTRRLVEDAGLIVRTAIAVQKPCMERRVAGTFGWSWPELEQVWVTSPQIPLSEYPTKDFPKEEVIAVAVGDLVRIQEYSGVHMLPQSIPNDVWEAGQELIALGYNQYLP